jgi:CheY-like chemotaxis protein
LDERRSRPPASPRGNIAAWGFAYDDEPVRTTVRETLEHFGQTVIEARDGTEGLALLPRAHVDLVITDIVMPGQEGLEVVRQVRRTQASVKILAISGGGRDGGSAYLHVAKLMGATTALAKPFTADALMAAVNELLPADA